jgi:hypothetical protein
MKENGKHFKRVNSVFKRFNDRRLYHSLKKCSINNDVILVLCNSHYKEVLVNWIAAMEQIRVRNYLVIALDQKLFMYLINNNINAYFHRIGNNKKDLWTARLFMVKKVLDLGFNVIHSDPDAIWLKDPQESFFRKNDWNISFSQGTIWPIDIYEKWGFVLCCGLYGIRSTESNRQLVTEIMKEMNNSDDDQTAVNRILFKKGIQWEVANPYKTRYKDKEFICSEDPIKGKSHGIDIEVLPHHLFQRIAVDNEAFVKHLLLERNGKSIMEILKDNQLIFTNLTK